MNKRICLWLCLVFLLLAAAQPAAASAVPALDPEHPCSLTLHYDKDGIGYAGLDIQIYRIASFLSDGSYALTGSFAEYPVKIHEITSQKEWQHAAQTLISYVDADGLTETAKGKTDPTGAVVFDNLKTGLYLVNGVDAEVENSRLRFESFLIFLPMPGENGEAVYDWEADPKPGSITHFARYKVIKLWTDAANVQNRPESISVEILCDGALFETVTLNAENNWTYSWEASNPESQWTVAEQDVPAGYTVTVEMKGDTFFVNNTFPNEPDDPPETGDSAQLTLWVLAMVFSITALPALCMLLKRRPV